MWCCQQVYHTKNVASGSRINDNGIAWEFGCGSLWKICGINTLVTHLISSCITYCITIVFCPIASKNRYNRAEHLFIYFLHCCYLHCCHSHHCSSVQVEWRQCALMPILPDLRSFPVEVAQYTLDCMLLWWCMVVGGYRRQLIGTTDCTTL